jgi:hypothetical protein
VDKYTYKIENNIYFLSFCYCIDKDTYTLIHMHKTS